MAHKVEASTKPAQPFFTDILFKNAPARIEISNKLTNKLCPYFIRKINGDCLEKIYTAIKELLLSIFGQSKKQLYTKEFKANFIKFLNPSLNKADRSKFLRDNSRTLKLIDTYTDFQFKIIRLQLTKKFDSLEKADNPIKILQARVQLYKSLQGKQQQILNFEKLLLDQGLVRSSSDALDLISDTFRIQVVKATKDNIQPWLKSAIATEQLEIRNLLEEQRKAKARTA